MSAKDRSAADRGATRPRVYPVSLQQAAAAIFGTVLLDEQSGTVSAPAINPIRKTDRENQ
jgi:hypothetical protein